jgi:hypothetical protein
MDIRDIFNDEISVNQKYVFVIMPFKEPFESLYSNIIHPVVTSAGYECEIADQPTNNAIIHDIVVSIIKSRIIIADISENNPNVMYELGIAHALQKEVIIIYDATTVGKEILSDIRYIRARMYHNTAPGGIKLKQDLTQTLEYVGGKIEKLEMTEQFEEAKKQEVSELLTMMKAQFEQRVNRVEYFTFHIIKLMFDAKSSYTEIRKLVEEYRDNHTDENLQRLNRKAKFKSDFLKNYTMDFTKFQLENARNFLHSAWLAIKYPDELFMLNWEMESLANVKPVLLEEYFYRDIDHILQSIDYKINRIDFWVSVMQEERTKVGLRPIEET